MDDLIQDLGSSARVLDLGASGGSFSYASTRAAVFALDLDFPPSPQKCSGRALADSRKLPFQSSSFDVVVCNHTLEHFEQPDLALTEINRVIKPGGALWIAVPNGFGFDDALYRFLFDGGGHVNRFSLDSLVQLVEEGTALRALRYKPLHSGFVYLQPPDPVKLQYYPRKAALLARLPPRLLRWGVRWMNWGTRFLDRWTKGGLSLYGFGVVFERRGGDATSSPVASQLAQIPTDRNVCCSCGAGHPDTSLHPLLQRHWLWQSYKCPLCGADNIYAS